MIHPSLLMENGAAFTTIALQMVGDLIGIQSVFLDKQHIVPSLNSLFKHAQRKVQHEVSPGLRIAVVAKFLQQGIKLQVEQYVSVRFLFYLRTE